MIKKIWYQSVKLFLKIGLHFYAQKIIIKGIKNIPKKGAVLFAVNHPNALIDPLFVTTFNPRENHFLVRADVFKKPLIRKFLSSLNLSLFSEFVMASNNYRTMMKCLKSVLKY